MRIRIGLIVIALLLLVVASRRGGIQSQAPSTTPTVSTSSPQTASVVTAFTPDRSTPQTAHYATKTEHPYTTEPLPADVLQSDVGAALVNIYCESSQGSIRPITGSGIIVSPQGTVLTNAHVAQYVLLSQDLTLGIYCVVKAGSPSVSRYQARVLYIPSIWINEHLAEIQTQTSMGNGEHDYALLALSYPAGVAAFPFVSPDTREAIGFTGDKVLIAAYPAETNATSAPGSGLRIVSSFAAINGLLSFATRTVDLLSIHGVPEAQEGSSGGAVTNAWNRLVGIITTTSKDAEVLSRELRALSVAYINRDIKAQTGFDLQEMLDKNPLSAANDFAAQTAPSLLEKYRAVLTHTH